MKLKNLLFILLFLPSFLLAQHAIEATFSPPEDFKWAILYKTTPTSNNYIDQKEIKDGKVEFILDTEATKGIYKLTYAAPQEEYNFDVIYSGEENIKLSFTEDIGVTFQQSSENLLLNEYLTNMSLVNSKIGDFYLQKRKNIDSLLSFFNEQTQLQLRFEIKSEGTFSYHFIKANKPYIPNKYEDEKTYINNLTSNYFTNIDFNNSTLQSSRFLMDRVFGYIVGVIPEGVKKNDAFNNNIDTITQKLSITETNYQKIFLLNLWQKLINYGFIDNANYIATTHLIPLSENLNDLELVSKLTHFKNLSIGSIAPEIKWEKEKNGIIEEHKLSDLTIAENYILVFWSSTCSHCLEQIPKLKTLVQSLDSAKYKVIAIGLEDDPIKWEKEVLKYPEFINIIKLNKWENIIIKTYGLTSTPAYFVLDKDKKFTAKPENLEGLEKFLEK